MFLQKLNLSYIFKRILFEPKFNLDYNNKENHDVEN